MPFYGDLSTMSRRSSKRHKRSAHKCRSHDSHIPQNRAPGSSFDSPNDSDSNVFGYGTGFTPSKTPQVKKKHPPLLSTPAGWPNIGGSNSATDTAGAGGPVQMPLLSGGLDLGQVDWSITSKLQGPSAMFPLKGLSDQLVATELKGYSMEELERLAHRDLAVYASTLQGNIQGMRKDAASLRTDLERMRTEITDLRGMMFI